MTNSTNTPEIKGLGYLIQRDNGNGLRYYAGGGDWVSDPVHAYAFMTETGAQRIADHMPPALGGERAAVVPKANAKDASPETVELEITFDPARPTGLYCVLGTHPGFGDGKTLRRFMHARGNVLTMAEDKRGAYTSAHREKLEEAVKTMLFKEGWTFAVVDWTHGIDMTDEATSDPDAHAATGELAEAQRLDGITEDRERADMEQDGTPDPRQAPGSHGYSAPRTGEPCVYCGHAEDAEQHTFRSELPPATIPPLPALDIDARLYRNGERPPAHCAVEKRIVWALLHALKAAGFKVDGLDDGEETTRANESATPEKDIMELTFNLDDSLVAFVSESGKTRCVKLVHGNGEDVISDWSVPRTPDGFDEAMDAFLERVSAGEFA